MAASERPVDRGARLGRAVLLELGEQARLARVASGLSQAEVARPLGLSRSTVATIEHGAPTTTVLQLAKLLGIVGLDLSARAYPGASPHRDAAHTRLLGRLRAELASGVDWRTEVPLPGRREPRTWDAMVRIGGLRIGVEAETRARDGQELLRRLHLKRRDGAPDRLVLVLSDTRGNRAFLRAHAASLDSEYPVDGHAAVRSLRAGMDPGGDAIVVL